MNIEELRLYCLAKKGTTEELPFGPDTLVFKVMGKMFALTALDTESCSVNLKCDPDRSEELREAYPDITPGYHMNKKLWNTVYCEGSLDNKFIQSLIDHSYDLVVAGLKKAEKAALEGME